VLGVHGGVAGFEDGGVFALRGIVGRERVAIQPAAEGRGAACGHDLGAAWIVDVNGDGEAGFALFAGRVEGEEFNGGGDLFEHGLCGLDFFGLGQEREDFGHGEDFDGCEKLGGEVRKSAGVEAARADFGQQIRAEHFAAIDQIDRRGHMARVAMLGLNGVELCGEGGREDEREVFGGGVAHGMLNEVGEGHGMAVARAVMSVLTRASRSARSRDSPME
jgi:hypothetical protein